MGPKNKKRKVSKRKVTKRKVTKRKVTKRKRYRRFGSKKIIEGGKGGDSTGGKITQAKINSLHDLVKQQSVNIENLKELNEAKAKAEEEAAAKAKKEKEKAAKAKKEKEAKGKAQ